MFVTFFEIIVTCAQANSSSKDHPENVTNIWKHTIIIYCGGLLFEEFIFDAHEYFGGSDQLVDIFVTLCVGQETINCGLVRFDPDIFKK